MSSTCSHRRTTRALQARSERVAYVYAFPSTVSTRICLSRTSLSTNALRRLEGKEYVVNEGDVLLFRFNV